MRRTSIVQSALALGILTLAAAAAAPQAQWKGTVVKEGDVTVVRNPKEPLTKTPVLELKEELAIGGPDAQGEAAFGSTRSVVVGDDGAVYVLDEQASDVKVFDAAGRHVRTIGRRGQGPGELEFPMTLSLNRAKGELVVQLQSRGLVFFKTDGAYLRKLSLKGLISGRGRVDSRGQVYVLEIALDDNGSRYVTKKLAPDASLLAVIGETPAPAGKSSREPIRAFLPVNYFLIDRADRFVYGHPATYEIQYFGPEDAKVRRRILREYDPVAVTAEDKAALMKTAPPGMPIEVEFPKAHPAYVRFFLSDLGHLFVQTYEKADGGRFVHDIFDAEGRFIGRMPLKPTGLEILKGKYYALEEDADGYQVVKRYAVTWLTK